MRQKTSLSRNHPWIVTGDDFFFHFGFGGIVSIGQGSAGPNLWRTFYSPDIVATNKNYARFRDYHGSSNRLPTKAQVSKSILRERLRELSQVSFQALLFRQ